MKKKNRGDAIGRFLEAYTIYGVSRLALVPMDGCGGPRGQREEWTIEQAVLLHPVYERPYLEDGETAIVIAVSGTGVPHGATCVSARRRAVTTVGMAFLTDEVLHASPWVALRGLLHKKNRILSVEVAQIRDMLLAVSARERLAKVADGLDARASVLSHDAYSLALYLELQYAAVAQLHRTVNDMLVPLREGRERDRAWWKKQEVHLAVLAEQVEAMVPLCTARCIKYLPTEIRGASNVAALLGDHHTTAESAPHLRDVFVGWLGKMELSLRQALLRPELERLVSVLAMFGRSTERGSATRQGEVLAHVSASLEEILAQQFEDPFDSTRDARFHTPVQADLEHRLRLASQACREGDAKRAKVLIAQAAHLL